MLMIIRDCQIGSSLVGKLRSHDYKIIKFEFHQNVSCYIYFNYRECKIFCCLNDHFFLLLLIFPSKLAVTDRTTCQYYHRYHEFEPWWKVSPHLWFRGTLGCSFRSSSCGLFGAYVMRWNTMLGNSRPLKLFVLAHMQLLYKVRKMTYDHWDFSLKGHLHQRLSFCVGGVLMRDGINLIVMGLQT